MAISEVCGLERLGTWVGTPAPDRIDIRLLLLGNKQIVESLDLEVCGFGKKEIIPAISVAMFSRDGNKRTIRFNRYAWEGGCASYPEIVTRPGSTWIIAFSERKGRAWKRIDTQGRVAEVGEALWDSMMDSLRRYYLDFIDREPESAVAEMVLGSRTYKYVRHLSGTPQLKAISMIIEMHPKASAKNSEKSFLGATRVMGAEELNQTRPASEASWPISFAIHLITAKNPRDADPFLGEYTDGQYRLVLLGDYDDLTVVSLGLGQKILAKGRSITEDCR